MAESGNGAKGATAAAKPAGAGKAGGAKGDAAAKDAAKDAAEASAPKSRRKRLMIAGIAAAGVAAAGGGAWWFLHGAHDDPEALAAAEAERKRKELKARVFLPLEQFTVNLADGGDRFAQVAVVLEVVNAQTSEDIKSQMPAVRNKILLLLSAKQPKELLSVAGKEKLANEIADATSRTIGWDPAKRLPVAKKKPAKKPEAEGEDAAAEDAEADGAVAGEPVPIPVVNVHFAQFIVQ